MTAPNCPFHGLDSLWIQVAGLSCNLRCTHCFNASGPGNREMPVLSREDVRTLLAEAEAAGVPIVQGNYDRSVGMRAEGIAEPFVRTIETGWWTTCLEILPAKERSRGLH
jgi:hypothetical protein